MSQSIRPRTSGFPAVLLALGLLAAGGCTTSVPHVSLPPPGLEAMPRELCKVALPPYVIETPDILLIDAVRVVPLPPYRVEPMDQLLIQSSGTFANEPINGIYVVDPDGTVNLGASYGAVRIVDLTIEQVRIAIERHLAVRIKSPQVNVALAQSRAVQQVRGEHLVRPDGTVGLGIYGSVFVTGMTLTEAKFAIEQHLSQFLYKPEIALDVYSYNSKFYYIITDGAGNGEQVVRLPATGNETVLDAMSQIYGLSPVSSRNRIWIARPAPAGKPDQVLPVDWKAITRGASTATNYQVLPGDRLYVQASPIITVDTWLGRIVSPIERTLGVSLLGASTVTAYQQLGVAGGGAGLLINP